MSDNPFNLTSMKIPDILIIICAAISSILFIILVFYRLISDNKPSKYKGNKSLDKIYDLSGGNEPLSNALMTSKINLSTDKYSCSYLVTYRGNNDRKVECMSGCSGDDENSIFCKKYEYPDGGVGSLNDTLLDDTYVARRRAKK